MECFNKSLVGKWIGRLLGESEGLWVRVLQSKYGGLGSVREMLSSRKGWSSSSIWWRDICKLFLGSNGDGMCRDFTRHLGEENNTSFWHDIWACEMSLKDKFPRLFLLSNQKNCRISEMGSWGNSSWEWDFQWCRGSRQGIELILNYYFLLLDLVNLLVQVPIARAQLMTSSGDVNKLPLLCRIVCNSPSSCCGLRGRQERRFLVHGDFLRVAFPQWTTCSDGASLPHHGAAPFVWTRMRTWRIFSSCVRFRARFGMKLHAG